MTADVAVNHVVSMSVGKRFQNLDNDVGFLPMAKLARFHRAIEIDTFDALHHGIGYLIPGAATVYDANDIGQIKAGNNVGFSLKTLARLCIRAELIDQQFDGGRTLQGVLDAAITMHHSAFANFEEI